MIKDTFIEIIYWIRNNKRKFFGGLIGFILSILILSIGFFKTFFIVLLTIVGIVVGSKSYTKRQILEFLERILPPGLK